MRNPNPAPEKEGQQRNLHKVIRLAIFWLPIIGALFLGVAATIWWGNGSKTVALWAFGYTGLLMLVTALALQLKASKTWIVVVVLLTGLFVGLAQHLGIYEPPPFNVTWQPVILDMSPNPKSVGMFVTYDNGVMSPIRVITELTVTSLQPVQSTIKTYSIQGASKSDGPWVTIPTVDSWADIYSLPSGLAAARKINMGQTAFNFKVLNHPLQPHDTVRGLLFFYSMADLMDWRFHRILLTDEAGVNFIGSLNEISPVPGQVNVQPAEMTILPGTYDLSKLKSVDIRQ